MSPLVLWDEGSETWVTLSAYTPPPDPSWPNETNSGYLGDPDDLTPLYGYQINTPGTVIQNRLVTEALRPNAANITIRNCIINAGYFGVDASTLATNLLIEDCTIIGGLNCGILCSGSGTTVRRCNIYGGDDGIKWDSSNGLMEDTYIHDLRSDPDAHNDGVQCSAVSNLTFRHNAIHSRDTSVIACHTGPFSNITIENNLLLNAGFLLYLANGTGMEVTDNTMDNWGFGPVTGWNSGGAGNVWSGNIDNDGNPVNP